MRAGTLALLLALTGCSGRPAALMDAAADGASDARGDGANDVGCPEGLTLCDGECVDTSSDPRHCGRCGGLCCSDVVIEPGCVEPQAECLRGRCLHPGGKMYCGDSVIDPQSDNMHCGECDYACDTTKGLTCVAGECRCGKASDTVCGGECVDLNSDHNHCGACGCACDGGAPECGGGKCQAVCQAPLKVCPDDPECIPTEPCGGGCPGSCVDTYSSNDHCGECNHSCDTANGFACIAGQCECVGGLTDCYGQCVPLNTTKHCGDCDTACATTGLTCQMEDGAWVCTYGCPPPSDASCKGACVNTQTDVSHCGGCFRPCTGGMTCTNGQCECPPLLPDDCGGTCVDQQNDPANCGGCGITCVSGACSGGQCQGDAGVIYPDAGMDAGMDLHVPD